MLRVIKKISNLNGTVYIFYIWPFLKKNGVCPKNNRFKANETMDMSCILATYSRRCQWSMCMISNDSDTYLQT